MLFWLVGLLAWLMVMGSIVIFGKAFGRRVDTIGRRKGDRHVFWIR
jgi:hypothetical protein